MVFIDLIKYNYIYVSSIEKIVVNLKKKVKIDIWYVIICIFR